jgi:predicted DNA-binding mobile mystery protein A
MKLNKRSLHQQRKQLDQKLNAWKSVSKTPRPRHGWAKAIRESIGMSSRQLAARLSTDNAAVLRLEKRESENKVTLEILDRAAAALGCRLVYAIIPPESLESLVDRQAIEAARDLLQSVSHSMKLENQQLHAAANQDQLVVRDFIKRSHPISC